VIQVLLQIATQFAGMVLKETLRNVMMMTLIILMDAQNSA